MIDEEKFLKANMQRLIQKESDLHELICALDLGVSTIYDRDKTIKIAILLINTLAQMDADLSAIIELLDN